MGSCNNLACVSHCGGGAGAASTDNDDARRISPRKWGRWCHAACLRAVSSEAFPLPAASPCVDDEPEELGPPAEELGPPAEARRRSSASTTSARSPRTPAAEEEGWGDGDEGCGAATADDPNGGGDGAARSGVVRAMREWRAKQDAAAAVAAEAVGGRRARRVVARPAYESPPSPAGGGARGESAVGDVGPTWVYTAHIRNIQQIREKHRNIPHIREKYINIQHITEKYRNIQHMTEKCSTFEKNAAEVRVIQELSWKCSRWRWLCSSC